MCSRHDPEAGAGSGVPPEARINFLPDGGHEWVMEPVQAACGHWIEDGESEGFCHLAPLHDGRCEPARYEVSD